jgi:hypothetical protein
MRKLSFVLLFAAVAAGSGVALAGPWDASFAPWGTITSVNPTAGNLKVPAGSYVKVQCDVAAYIGHGAGNTTSCSSSTCEKKIAGDPLYVRLLPSEDYVAALAVGGTATCLVLRATGQ